MSDCHRGDGGWADDFTNNQTLFYAALYEYNKKKFTYIELGDGDELWENKKVSDTVSIYQNIFALMSQFYKDKRLYLLYGNHDIEKRETDFFKNNFTLFDLKEKKDTPLFPNIEVYEGLTLKHKVTGDKVFLLHGHQVDLLNGPLWRLSRFLVRYVWRPLEIIGVNDPTSAAKNRKRKNEVEKKLVQWAEKEKQMLIAGHTHKPAFPEPGAPPYFNDGSCVHRQFITALEIEKGAISLVRWINKTKADGTIYVGRDVLAGPQKLNGYFNLIQ
jgi:UDP-2,3-diacylglucosamine pyrophosphatase LpxH